jgi:hypothetical protein
MCYINWFPLFRVQISEGKKSYPEMTVASGRIVTQKFSRIEYFLPDLKAKPLTAASLSAGMTQIISNGQNPVRYDAKH